MSEKAKAHKATLGMVIVDKDGKIVSKDELIRLGNEEKRWWTMFGVLSNDEKFRPFEVAKDSKGRLRIWVSDPNEAIEVNPPE